MDQRILKRVTRSDFNSLVDSDREYGSSWKKRGGVGAFMMLARKWDRLENALRPRETEPTQANCSTRVAPWDILEALRDDQREEGILDDIRDLRRYLALVEMEYLSRQAGAAQKDMEFVAGTPDDGGHHEMKELWSTEYREGYTHVIDNWWILNPDLLTDEEKELYDFKPDLELNTSEMKGMSLRQQALYNWDESQLKWILNERLLGWHV